MALHHAESGELIDLRNAGAPDASVALVRSDELEVMRLTLPKGKSIPEHWVAGELTLQCLEGEVEVRAHGRAQALRPQQMIYLQGKVPYALQALDDSLVVMTVLRKPGEADQGG